jgi:Bacterial PH domain
MNIIKETIDIANVEIKTQSKGLFDFLTHSEMNFDGKKQGEEILVFTRRHWFVLLGTVFVGVFASVLPLLLVILGAKILIQYNLSQIFTLTWVIYLMVIWFYVFYKLTMYALDSWIVTNERILDISQIALFKRKVSELHLTSIEDTSVHTDGFIQSYLNFGDVEIQTAGATQRFLFDDVPKPLEIKDTIMTAAGKFVDK